MDIDTLMQMKAEEKQVEQWTLRKQKSIMRRGISARCKQEEWNKYFTEKKAPDDSYILNGLVY